MNNKCCSFPFLCFYFYFSAMPFGYNIISSCSYTFYQMYRAYGSLFIFSVSLYNGLKSAVTKSNQGYASCFPYLIKSFSIHSSYISSALNTPATILSQSRRLDFVL